MQTGMRPARGSPGDSRLAPVPPAHPDTAGKTSPLQSSEESAGRSTTWLGGREETLLPQIAWELARQDPSIVPGTLLSQRWGGLASVARGRLSRLVRPEGAHGRDGRSATGGNHRCE